MNSWSIHVEFHNDSNTTRSYARFSFQPNVNKFTQRFLSTGDDVIDDRNGLSFEAQSRQSIELLA